MLFRQLFDTVSSTYTYFLADEESREAVVIDSVFELAQRDLALIRELNLKPLWILETHVHADHVTGASILKRATGAQTAVSKDSGAEGADRYLSDGEVLKFGRHELEARATPGHTNGCMTFVLDKGLKAFTGDTLMVRAVGRTDFQQGSAHTLYESIHQRIYTLPDTCEIWPGHDYQGRTQTSVLEEKRFNPRIAQVRSVEDFVGTMHNLNLPHPKQIDVAVPANLKMGRRDEGLEGAVGLAQWAPLQISYAGIPEVDPAWVEEHASKVQLIDVREASEFTGELSHIKGAHLLPLGIVVEKAATLDKSKPIVTVCRSGGRSGQAVVLLKKAGFDQVASMAGGMLRYRAEKRR